MKNCDSFYSSTFFYKPDNEDKLYAGIVWDFDTAGGIRADEIIFDDPTGYLGKRIEFLFLNNSSVQLYLKEYYESYLYNLINDVLLGNENGKYLKNIDEYADINYYSQKMNYTIWKFSGMPVGTDRERHIYKTYEENIDYLKEYLLQRNEWFKEQIENWTGEDIIDITL